MIPVGLKKRLDVIEEQHNVKRKLPWDCKALFSQYQRGDIINTLAGRKDFFRLVVDDTRDLSFEAREFLSLSGAGQARAIEQNTPVVSKIEAEEVRRNILDRLFR